MILRHQPKTRVRRELLAAKIQRRRTHTARDCDRVYRWVFDQGVRVGPAFQFKGYDGENPTTVATTKINSDKRERNPQTVFTVTELM